MKSKSKVLIAIVTYNGEKYIKKCLDSIISKQHEIEIFIFDNSSKDTTLDILENYKHLTTKYSTENYGFGKANNFMMQYASRNKFDFIYLLNQDTYFLEGSLDTLVNFAIQNPAFAIYSPIHLSSDEKTMDLSFQKYIETESKESHDPRITEKKFINAAAWLIPIRTLNSIGGFSPLFFHYGEDRDYAYRLIAKGGSFIIVNTSHIVHDRESNNNEKTSIKARKKIVARAKINLLRHAGNINDRLSIALLKVVFYGMGEAKKSLTKGELNLALGHMKNILSTYLEIPYIVTHRKKATKENAFL